MVRVHSGLPFHIPSTMPCMFILRSIATSTFYIGSTVDFDGRLQHHQAGFTPSTKGRGPWTLEYREDFATLHEASSREREVKSWKSHRTIAELIDRRSVV